MRCLGFVVAVVALAGCPKSQNPRYCDSTTRCSTAPFLYCNFAKKECESTPQPIFDMSIPSLDLAASMNDMAGSGPPDMVKIACTSSMTCPASMPTCSNTVCGRCSAGSTDCSTYHSATPQCGPSGGCVECIANGDCFSKAQTPFCGPSNTCVQCLKASDCTPQVCGSDNKCRACQTNPECPSGVCNMATGNCVDASMVYYVDNGGMTIANCYASRANRNGTTVPWCDISEAAQGSGFYTLVTGHGAAFPYSPFTVVGAENFIGPGYKAAMPAVVKANTTSGGVVTVTDATVATIDGFEIDGLNMQDGITCAPSSPTEPMPHRLLNVRNSYIHNTSGNAGLYPKNCDLNVDNSRVSTSSIRVLDDTPSTFVTVIKLTNSQFDTSSSDGVYVNRGVLTMDRCLVISNAANGIQLWNPTFTVTNSFFYGNGLAVDFSANAGTPQSVFMFNTVAYNNNGFSCNQTTIQASISIHNGGALIGGTGASQCRTIDIVTDNAPTLPVFVNTGSPSTYDFHLATDTPAHLAANQACCIDKVKGPLDGGTSPLPTHDFDGTTRPLGMGYDIGAHEAK
jgi:hypothetical protein